MVGGLAARIAAVGAETVVAVNAGVRETLEYRPGVAGFAGSGDMGAGQRKAGRAVIEVAIDLGCRWSDRGRGLSAEGCGCGPEDETVENRGKAAPPPRMAADRARTARCQPLDSLAPQRGSPLSRSRDRSWVQYRLWAEHYGTVRQRGWKRSTTKCSPQTLSQSLAGQNRILRNGERLARQLTCVRASFDHFRM